MTVPIIENIAVNIAAAVDAITTVNGFNQDLSALRPRRNDFSDVVPEDGKVLVVQDDEDQAEQPIGVQEWIQTFVLVAMVIDSDSASGSIDTRINQVRADIRKKMMEDPTRGGNAIDTILLPAAKFDDGEGFTGIAVAVAVQYRVEHDDPYTKA